MSKPETKSPILWPYKTHDKRHITSSEAAELRELYPKVIASKSNSDELMRCIDLYSLRGAQRALRWVHVREGDK